MGVYTSVYLGIYLEIPKKKKEIVKNILVNPETGKESQHLYCPNTGVKSESRTKLVIEDVNPHPYVEDNDNLSEDMFYCPEYYSDSKNVALFVVEGNDFSKSIDTDELNRIEVTDLNIDSLKEQFEIDYEEYLTAYRKLYGEVNVKFGVVSYAS